LPNFYIAVRRLPTMMTLIFVLEKWERNHDLQDESQKVGQCGRQGCCPTGSKAFTQRTMAESASRQTLWRPSKQVMTHVGSTSPCKNPRRPSFMITYSKSSKLLAKVEIPASTPTIKPIGMCTSGMTTILLLHSSHHSHHHKWHQAWTGKFGHIRCPPHTPKKDGVWIPFSGFEGIFLWKYVVPFFLFFKVPSMLVRYTYDPRNRNYIS
jgi:hypothetical protein